MGFSNPHVGFTDFDVALRLDSAKPELSEFSVTIVAGSIDSRVAEFNTHLKGADYFDVGAHPEIHFASSSLTMTSADTVTIEGMLTIKGVSKPVTLNATLNKAGMHPLAKVPTLGVSATAAIKRSEWGLGKYVPMVGDNVDIRIEVELPMVN
jgi:polyisoprenoid-binding protein YceI